jgi:7-cyano-7-deazaguanine reductase
MALKELDNSNISKHLGQTSSYASQYDPSLLVREPRSSNRKHLNLDKDNLPFTGSDTWNAYEISALTDNGLPVSAIIKLVYSCENDYIVESKSIKLYFNSFNMTKLGPTSEAVLENIKYYAERDLSDLLETQVSVYIFTPGQGLCVGTVFWNALETYHNEYKSNDGGFKTIDDCDSSVVFDTYTETPELLKFEEHGEDVLYKYHSSALKSNCRVTSQPDFGDVYITFKSKYKINEESLLKYIVSFRDECHFHEEICETIYTRLWDTGLITGLGVMCLYTRRGGIDICPERVSSADYKHHALSTGAYHVKTPRQ